MYRRLSLIIFIIGFALFGATQASQIKLQTVFEKTFEDTIVDVIFDTATVSLEEAKAMGWKEGGFTALEKKKESMKILYPKAIFIGVPGTFLRKGTKEIKIFDSFGKQLNKIHIGLEEGVYNSSNGKYILVGRIPDSEGQGGRLYDINGNLLKEFKELSPVAVSNDGYVIAGHLPFEGEGFGDFVLFDPDGREVLRIRNPLESATGWAVAKFTEDQEYIIISYTDAYSKSVLIVANKNGKVLWQKEFNQDAFHRGSEVIGLKDLGIAGISQDNKGGIFCYFYNWGGILKWEIPLEIRGDMIVKFSKDTKKLYVTSTEGYLWCIDISNGKILWCHKEPWAPDPQIKKPWPWEVPLFRELEIINDTLYIIGRQGRNWHSSTLFIFDGESGSLLRKIEYPHEKISIIETDRGIGLINTTQRMVSIFKKEVLK